MKCLSKWRTAWAAAAMALALGCSCDRDEGVGSSVASAAVHRTVPPADDSKQAGPKPSDSTAVPTTRPEGYLPVTVAGVTPTPHGSAVLLLEQESQRVVPIFVGSTEALVIELRLEHRRYGRPLTHDLLDSVLQEVGSRVDSVRVDRLTGGVFHATVVFTYEGKKREIDARSSDAVAIALGHGTPIFMAHAVLAEAGMSLESVQAPDGWDGGSLPPNAPEDENAVTL